MTRESRTISAVFMAVLLVLASGTAVSVAVTDSSTTDVGTNAVGAQETTTAANDGETASVTFEDQETDGAEVVVESVTMPEGGFIAIHDSSVADAPLSSVLGNSVYLEAGTHEDVSITLARPITEDQTLVAMPHLDTNDNEVYDFVLSTGELDGPYTANESVVIDPANVTVAQDTTTTTEEAEETTTTEEVVEETTTTEEVVEETTTTEEVVEETTTTEEVVEETTTTEEVVEETTTTEEVVEETTTTEEVVEETTTTEEVVEETTTEEVVEETTTTEEVVEETTTTEEVVEETTTTEEVVEETTTTEEVVEETTTTEEVEETTTTEVVEEPPAEMEQFIFKVEQMSIDEWSFVVGDEETPDRTETISNVDVQDRRVVINLTEILQQSDVSEEDLDEVTTQDPEQVEEQLEENLSQDIPTVRFVIENVNVENVTFVIMAPEDVELPQPPMMTTTEEVEETTTTEEVEETTTTEEIEETTTTEEIEETTTTEEIEETTTTEEVEETTTTEEVEETTTTEEVEETTTTEEVEETTTTEEVEETTTTEEVEETTTTEEVEETTTTEEVEETTTTEEVEETTTTEEVEETTTTEEPAADLNSFEVSQLDAPQNATTGDTITVSAMVRNPNDQEATQAVAFRLEGTVIARQSVTLDAGEETTVEFEIDTEGVPAGQYIHGIYTQDFGELAVLVLEEPTTETTTTAANETTTAEA